MLYFVIGLPGRFTEWCDVATAEIARRALGPTEFVRADTLEEISLWMIRTGASRGVVTSRQPGGRLRLLWSKRDAPSSPWSKSHRRFSRKQLGNSRTTCCRRAVGCEHLRLDHALCFVARSARALSRPRWQQSRDHRPSDSASLALNVSDTDISEIVDDLAAAGLTYERSDGAARSDGL